MRTTLNAPSVEQSCPPVPGSASSVAPRWTPRSNGDQLRTSRPSNAWCPRSSPSDCSHTGKVTGERCIVTILFSDVKGSTAMAERLDPEEVMDGAVDVLIEPIYRYEGTLARLMGDAILASFGAPIAHEDDPERACRAALEIIEGAKRHAARLEEERGISGFNVRVGINTGLVVVGEVGSDLRVEYTTMGNVINLASRMESGAEPGTVLITEDTQKLIAPLFESEALGPIEVKGKKEPVPVHRVVAVKAVPEKLRGMVGLESPLVGRQAEFSALQGAVERPQAGVGGIVTLVGEAGLGKSRLAACVSLWSTQAHWLPGRSRFSLPVTSRATSGNAPNRVLLRSGLRCTSIRQFTWHSWHWYTTANCDPPTKVDL